ncbi:MAG: hypothetical protein J2P36_16140 [Ktedonobacteraceae bacterium]|nr:hypothetical protein [Ktedonobacteraceae bacterium]
MPNDYEQVKEHYFRQGGGKWKTVLGVETTTCVHSSTTIAAGIYLDPERRNPHYRSEDTILTAGMMAGAFDLELLQGGEEKSKSFVREASSLRKSFLNLRDMFHHLPATSPSHSVEMKGKDSSSPPHKIDKLFHDFDEIAQQEFDELASDMVNDYGFAPHQFLEALGLPISLMGPTTMEGLAAHYGKVVSVGVDAYVLWDDSSEHPVSFQQINHRVLSLGPAYDGSSGERAGLLFIDTGKNYENGAGVFKPNATCEKAISPKEWSFVIDQFRPGFQA